MLHDAPSKPMITGFFDKMEGEGNNRRFGPRINVTETPIPGNMVRITLYAPAAENVMTAHGASPPVYPWEYEDAPLATLPMKVRAGTPEEFDAKPGDPLNPFPVSQSQLMASESILQGIADHVGPYNTGMGTSNATARRTGNIVLWVTVPETQQAEVMRNISRYLTEEQGFEPYVKHSRGPIAFKGDDSTRKGGSSATVESGQQGGYYNYADASGVETRTFIPHNGGLVRD